MMRNRRHMIAEVEYLDDRGIWHVLQLTNLPDKALLHLLEHEYGIRKEWIRQIQRKPSPKRRPEPEWTLEELLEVVYDPKNDRSVRRFLPEEDFGDCMPEDYEN